MAGGDGASVRILIIDDDSIMVELLSALLEHEGHVVRVARTGDEGVAALKEQGAAVDVVLTDLQMPGLQGKALAAALHEALGPATVLVGMSGRAAEPEERELLDAFLQKPFTNGQFDAAVRTARERRAGQTAAGREPVAPMQRQSEPTAGAAPHEESRGRGEALNTAVFNSLLASLDDDQLRQLYDLTIEDTQKRIDRMEKAALEGDEATVRREAHAIRGGCGMVGATELHRLATAAEGGSVADTSVIADFRSACQRLRRMLDGMFSD